MTVMKATDVMPKWGPYSKKYMGISHVCDELKEQGGRFDFIVHPTVWNSSVAVPNVTFPSGYHLLKCSPDYSFYSYRYELKDKKTVYADVSFSKLTEDAFLLRCEFVNKSGRSEEFVLNTFAALELPCRHITKPVLPANSMYCKANDYEVYEYAKPRPWDSENPDGMSKGMFFGSEFVNGIGLGDRVNHNHVSYMGFRPFGCEKGDRVSWKLSSENIENASLAIRYRTVTDGDGIFLLNGEKIILSASKELSIAYFPFHENPELISLGGAGVEFDFIACVPGKETLDVSVLTVSCEPDVITEVTENGTNVRLDYSKAGGPCYYVYSHDSDLRLRHVYSGCLEDALPNRLSNGDPTFDKLQETFSRSFTLKTSDEGHYINLLVRSIQVPAGKTCVKYMVVAKKDFIPYTPEEYEASYVNAVERDDAFIYNEDGEKYSFSVNMLRTTLLTNVVYPVFKKDGNVIHYTPGKRWDSFYTWDSGFIGLGLLEADAKLSQYVLDTYLCDENNKDYSFLLHGSLVPTQFPLYLELLKRTNDKHELDYLYDELKLYYEFLRGRRGSSSMGKFGNGLLTAYDYWYSCSGMDDYPAQVMMIKEKAEDKACPCITTSFVILAGKILRMAAFCLGKKDDVTLYERDIKESSDALNNYAWDEESGYYGYTVYDENSNKPHIMRTQNDENCNKGMDGIYPLIAGVPTKERKKILLGHLKNPKEMWSSAGISAVDMSAGYYRDNGYWNGNVWMAHQWFVWKAMLDIGESDFAFEIAKRALDIWKEETDESWNTYECFNICTHRGGWFHQFGGLSSPVCIFANAYYKPGTITTGFDVWIDSQYTDTKMTKFKFRYFGSFDRYTMLMTVNADVVGKVTLDGVPIDFKMRTMGTVEITLQGSIKEGTVEICLKKRI